MKRSHDCLNVSNREYIMDMSKRRLLLDSQQEAMAILRRSAMSANNGVIVCGVTFSETSERIHVGSTRRLLPWPALGE